MRKLVSLLGVLALLVLGVVPSMAQDTANVRVGHFSPDAPAVDVYVDGEVAVEGLEYPGVTEFLELPAGSYEIAVAPAGTSVDEAVIGPADFVFDADTHTTVAAVGTIENESLDVTVFTESTDDIAEGNARATFLHAVADGPIVDVYGSDILLVQSLRFPDATADGAFTRELPAGLYNFEITLAENPTGLLADTGEDIRMAEGEQYLIAAIGTVDEPQGFFIADMDGDTVFNQVEREADIVDEDAAEEAAEDQAEAAAMDGTAYVRVGHFSPDAPAVDVYIDGEVAVEGAEYPAATGFLELQAGSHEIAIAPAGTSVDDAVIGPADFTFEPDTYTTIAAVGTLEGNSLDVTTFTEPVGDIDADNARVTFLHAVADGPIVDVYGSDIRLVQSLRFPGAATDGAFTRQLLAGLYNFEITLAENPSALLADTNEEIRIEEGEQYLVVAIGTVDNPEGFFVTTIDGDVVFSQYSEE